MIYQHKKTGINVQLVASNPKNSRYVGDTYPDLTLPEWVVEKSTEWDLMDNEKTYSIEEIRLAYACANKKISSVGINPTIEAIIEAILKLK